jgi:hypothetical protein
MNSLCFRWVYPHRDRVTQITFLLRKVEWEKFSSLCQRYKILAAKIKKRLIDRNTSLGVSMLMVKIESSTGYQQVFIFSHILNFLFKIRHRQYFLLANSFRLRYYKTLLHVFSTNVSQIWPKNMLTNVFKFFMNKQV